MLIVNAICEKSAVQEKHIEKYLKSSDTAFFEFADKFFLALMVHMKLKKRKLKLIKI